MSIGVVCALLVAGLLIGTVSGMVGIGGGLLVIPLLIIFFGFSQQKAAGTSLAMLLPPIGVFAVITYARAGNIDWPVAALLAAGFAAGGFVGAKVINSGVIPETGLRVGFSLFMMYVAASLLFRTGGRARAAVETSVMVGGFLVAYVFFRVLGKWFLRHPRWGRYYRERAARGLPPDFEI